MACRRVGESRRERPGAGARAAAGIWGSSARGLSVLRASLALLFLSTVWIGAPAASWAQCTLDVTGTIATCTGSQPANGVTYTQPVVELDVNSLSQPIAPASGTVGVSLINTANNGNGGSSHDTSSGDNGGGGTTGSDIFVTVAPGSSPSLGISTTSAIGVLAKSIGGSGGGGGSGVVVSGTGGGTGGAGAAGGGVTVQTSGTIATTTSGAGVFALSQGGNGGGGDGVSVSGGNGSDGGVGGTVSVTSSSTINVNGEGIFAESLGGSGGGG